MLIIPEIKTVVILVPRTGSGSTFRAVKETYPKAMMLYRHMEADGVPFGYDRWPKVGVVRDPVERLWSMYKFCHVIDTKYKWFCDKIHNSVKGKTFEEWLLTNETVFTSPYSTDPEQIFYPEFLVHHSIPENVKSQYIYLRPDLGTQVYQFSDLDKFANRLGIQLGHKNKTIEDPPPPLSAEAQAHIQKFFKWDLFVTDVRDTEARRITFGKLL